MKYKFNAYNGYYLFPNNLNVPSSGVYNINATYYNDDGTINETVTGTVIIDIDSYINTEEIDINDDEAILVNVYVLDRFEDGAIVIGYYDNGHVHQDKITLVINSNTHYLKNQSMLRILILP